MSFNFAKCTDRELAELCVRHNIIQANELRNYTRETVVNTMTQWCIKKQEIKRQRRLSAPQLSSHTQTHTQTKQIHTTATTGNLKRV